MLDPFLIGLVFYANVLSRATCCYYLLSMGTRFRKSQLDFKPFFKDNLSSFALMGTLSSPVWSSLCAELWPLGSAWPSSAVHGLLRGEGIRGTRNNSEAGSQLLLSPDCLGEWWSFG